MMSGLGNNTINYSTIMHKDIGAASRNVKIIKPSTCKYVIITITVLPANSSETQTLHFLLETLFSVFVLLTVLFGIRRLNHTLNVLVVSLIKIQS